jgi:ABC-type sugar transport system permease subunit
MIMIIDGALQSVDKACYESAELDGAGRFTKAYRITVPCEAINYRNPGDDIDRCLE